MFLRSALVPRPTVDVWLAAALLVWAETEVATGSVRGSVAINVAAATVSTAALAWRRSSPATVAVISAGGLVFKTAFGLPLDGLALLAAMLVAAYSVGRHAPPRRAGGTIAIVVVLAWLSLFGLSPKDQTAANYPFIALWVGGPAAAGAALRAQVAAAQRQANRAARAEWEREEHARRAVADERLRIAWEMHDTVGHAVSMMVLHAGAVRSRLPAALDSERGSLSEVEVAGRQAIAELQRLLRVLRSSTEIAPPPTLDQLDALIEQTRRAGIDVRVAVSGDRPALEPAFEVTIYRIVQEALTNVRKHSQAKAVCMDLAYDDSAVRLRVADDGVERLAPSPGHGLVGIRERAEVYGGTATMSDCPHGGFVLDVRLPLDGR